MSKGAPIFFNFCFTTDCFHLVDSVDLVDCFDNVNSCYFKKSFDYDKLEEMLGMVL